MKCQYCATWSNNPKQNCSACGAAAHSAFDQAAFAAQQQAATFHQPPPHPHPPPPLHPATFVRRRNNPLAVAGLVLAFLFPPVGFLLSCIGLAQCKKSGDPGRGIAIAGIIISALVLFSWLRQLVSVFYFINL